MLIKIILREVVRDALENGHSFVYAVLTEIFAVSLDFVERIVERYVMVYAPGLDAVPDHSGYHFISRVYAWCFITEEQYECQKRQRCPIHYITRSFYYAEKVVYLVHHVKELLRTADFTRVYDFKLELVRDVVLRVLVDGVTRGHGRIDG